MTCLLIPRGIDTETDFCFAPPTQDGAAFLNGKLLSHVKTHMSEPTWGKEQQTESSKQIQKPRKEEAEEGVSWGNKG